MLYYCKDSDSDLILLLCSVLTSAQFLKMTQATSSAMLEKSVVDKYLSLPQYDRVCATYIWIDGTGEGLRSKVSNIAMLRGLLFTCSLSFI